MVCIDGQCLCVCLAGVYCESRQCVSVSVCVRARAHARACRATGTSDVVLTQSNEAQTTSGSRTGSSHD